MKIITVVNNYSDNTITEYNSPETESNNDAVSDVIETVSDNPGWYVMPDSCIMRTGNPLFLPPSPAKWHARLSMAVRIGRLGKGISEKFAPRYYSEMTLAVILSDDDKAARLMRAGLPPAAAYIFDRACILGDFINQEEFDYNNDFILSDGKDSIKWNLKNIKHSLNETISHFSNENTLKIGDIFVVGLTADFICLKQDTHLRAYALGSEDNHLIDINVK